MTLLPKPKTEPHSFGALEKMWVHNTHYHFTSWNERFHISLSILLSAILLHNATQYQARLRELWPAVYVVCELIWIFSFVQITYSKFHMDIKVSNLFMKIAVESNEVEVPLKGLKGFADRCFSWILMLSSARQLKTNIKFVNITEHDTFYYLAWEHLSDLNSKFLNSASHPITPNFSVLMFCDHKCKM